MLRVRAPGRVVAPTVVLYPTENESECDCPARVSPCEHVAAAAISLSAPKEEGAAPAERPVARVGYRFTRGEGGLRLARVLVEADGSEAPLGGALASRLADPAQAARLQVEDVDLRADALLEAGGAAANRGVLLPTKLDGLMRILTGAGRIQLDGVPVAISEEEILPVATLTDAAGPAGTAEVRLTIAADPRVRAAVAAGVVLCEDDGRAIAAPSRRDRAGRRLAAEPPAAADVRGRRDGGAGDRRAARSGAARRARRAQQPTARGRAQPRPAHRPPARSDRHRPQRAAGAGLRLAAGRAHRRGQAGLPARPGSAARRAGRGSRRRAAARRAGPPARPPHQLRRRRRAPLRREARTLAREISRATRPGSSSRRRRSSPGCASSPRATPGRESVRFELDFVLAAPALRSAAARARRPADRSTPPRSCAPGRRGSASFRSAKARLGVAAARLAGETRRARRRSAGRARGRRPPGAAFAARPRRPVRRAGAPAPARPRSAGPARRRVRASPRGAAAARSHGDAARVSAPGDQLARLPARRRPGRRARRRHGPRQDLAGDVRVRRADAGRLPDERRVQLAGGAGALPARPQGVAVSRGGARPRRDRRRDADQLRAAAPRREGAVGARLERRGPRRGAGDQEPRQPDRARRVRAARVVPAGADRHARREPARGAVEPDALHQPRPAGRAIGLRGPLRAPDRRGPRGGRRGAAPARAPVPAAPPQAGRRPRAAATHRRGPARGARRRRARRLRRRARGDPQGRARAARRRRRRGQEQGTRHDRGARGAAAPAPGRLPPVAGARPERARRRRSSRRCWRRCRPRSRRITRRWCSRSGPACSI